MRAFVAVLAVLAVLLVLGLAVSFVASGGSEAPAPTPTVLVTIPTATPFGYEPPTPTPAPPLTFADLPVPKWTPVEVSSLYAGVSASPQFLLDTATGRLYAVLDPPPTL